MAERPKRRKTETRRTKTDVRAPAARFTAVTVGIGQKRRENVAKRVETCQKLGQAVKTEENGNTTDEKDGKRTYMPRRTVHGRHGGKRRENVAKRVKNVVERLKRR